MTVKVFSDANMEGPPGGLTSDGLPIHDLGLETHYHQSGDDGPWYECDAFLERLQSCGFTHVDVTWEGEDADLMRLSDWKPDVVIRDGQTLTVRELLAALRGYDPDLPVFMRAGDNPLCEIERVDPYVTEAEGDEVLGPPDYMKDLVGLKIVRLGGGGR